MKWIADNAKVIGIFAYLYEHDPRPGTIIADKVKWAIDGSDAVVVLLSQYSQFSPYVQQEIGYAEGKGKLIVPLVQPGIDQRAFAMLQGREYIYFDLYRPNDALNVLLEFLKKRAQEKSNAAAWLMALGGLALAGYFVSAQRE